MTTSASGTVAELSDYYPYGSPRLDEASGTPEQRKFVGEQYDADTALSYLNARYYNGSVGRFVSEDPAFLAVGDNEKIKQEAGNGQQSVLANPQDLNSYGYAEDNPIVRSDPSGESSLSPAQKAVANYQRAFNIAVTQPLITIISTLHAAGQSFAQQHPQVANLILNAATVFGGEPEEGLPLINSEVNNGTKEPGSFAEQIKKETQSGKGNFTSKVTPIPNSSDILNAGSQFLGEGYNEIGKPGSGVFQSADQARQFRIDSGSVTGSHDPFVPHAHFESVDSESTEITANNHVPFNDN